MKDISLPQEDSGDAVFWQGSHRLQGGIKMYIISVNTKYASDFVNKFVNKFLVSNLSNVDL